MAEVVGHTGITRLDHRAEEEGGFKEGAGERVRRGRWPRIARGGRARVCVNPPSEATS